MEVQDCKPVCEATLMGSFRNSSLPLVGMHSVNGPMKEQTGAWGGGWRSLGYHVLLTHVQRCDFAALNSHGVVVQQLWGPRWPRDLGYPTRWKRKGVSSSNLAFQLPTTPQPTATPPLSHAGSTTLACSPTLEGGGRFGGPPYFSHHTLTHTPSQNRNPHNTTRTTPTRISTPPQQFEPTTAAHTSVSQECAPRRSSAAHPCRSSALASKATGFPIAKMAAKLAVGYTLDQIPNDITQKTPACFEPSIDYIVTKIPRFAFEKFPGTEPVLTTQMKSVGAEKLPTRGGKGWA